MYSIDDGNEILLHDAERSAYHALSREVFTVWKHCDGTTNVATILDTVRAEGIELSSDTVLLALAELGEAGLLEAPQDGWDARIQRRKIMKLIAAGLLGGVLFPSIASMTAPESTAAASLICPDPQGVPRLGSCTYSCQCVSGYCCRFGRCTARNNGIGCAREYP